MTRKEQLLASDAKTGSLQPNERLSEKKRLTCNNNFKNEPIFLETNCIELL
jgi:hypothetical protein